MLLDPRFRKALGHGLQSFFKCFESAWSLSCWCRGCLKTEEKMRKATLRLQPRRTSVVQKLRWNHMFKQLIYDL